jgi:hypothetical protein
MGSLQNPHPGQAADRRVVWGGLSCLCRQGKPHIARGVRDGEHPLAPRRPTGRLALTGSSHSNGVGGPVIRDHGLVLSDHVPQLTIKKSLF